jgi:excisionase family DNA binding protein
MGGGKKKRKEEKKAKKEQRSPEPPKAAGEMSSREIAQRYMVPRALQAKLSGPEIAAIFGVSLQTVHNWVNARGLPVTRTMGRRLRFTPFDLIAYFEEHNIEVPDELRQLAKVHR